jgi:hypothetical protein
MHEIIKELAQNINWAKINDALVAIIGIAGAGIAVYFKTLAKKTTAAFNEKQKSIKRSTLRNEYLSIYNSDKITLQEKYEMTRDVVEDYTALNGNHYVKALDEKLAEALAEETAKKEVNK